MAYQNLFWYDVFIMKRRIYISLLVLVVAIVVLLTIFPKTTSHIELTTPNNKENISENNSNTSSTTDSATKLVLSKPQSPEWEVFQKYITFAKNHDLEGIKTLSYQISETCKDKNLEKQCFALMDNVYQIGSNLKESNYVNKWSDGKQIIISTNPVKKTEGDNVGYQQGFIIFTKDNSGNLKLLGLDPYKSVYLSKKDFSATELETRLKAMLADSDKDGLYDEEENCSGIYSNPKCIKTNPNKRDSDGDGWWDRINSLFYKN